MRLRLDNYSGYDTADLRRFVLAGLRAVAPRLREAHVVIVASPIRSRGCADVGGRRMVLAVGPPSRFSLRRLSRLLEHEAGHLRGEQHEDMPRGRLYSLGRIPDWCRRWYAAGGRIRYRGRAPGQLALLLSRDETVRRSRVRRPILLLRGSASR
jgi:hypothetical protein